MIRILNKPLLKEWTATQLSRPAANSSFSFSRCRRPFSVASYAPLYCHAPFPRRASIQHYSTIPDQSTSVKTKSVVPPPSNPTSKKNKVDLRPAPKKPGREPSNNVKLHRSPGPTLQPKSTSPPATPTPAPPDVSKGSLGPSKAMRHDIATATEKGILTPPPEGVSRVGRLWHQFVQLFKFYWGGLKMIFITHRHQAVALRRRAAEARAKGEESGLSRRETRFLRTYDRDLVKLVPFILTLIILEEALPFVVLYAPALLPSTCLLPSQRERIEAKRRAKQMEHSEHARTELLRLGQHSTASLTEKSVRSLNSSLARAVSGLFSRPTWGPLFLQQRRIEKRLAYLSSDDSLLAKEGLGNRLTEAELAEAIEERGLIPDSRTPQHLREQLQWWLRGAHDDKTRLALILQASLTKTGVKVNTDV